MPFYDILTLEKSISGCCSLNFSNASNFCCSSEVGFPIWSMIRMNIRACEAITSGKKMYCRTEKELCEPDIIRCLARAHRPTTPMLTPQLYNDKKMTRILRRMPVLIKCLQLLQQVNSCDTYLFLTLIKHHFLDHAASFSVQIRQLQQPARSPKIIRGTLGVPGTVYLFLFDTCTHCHTDIIRHRLEYHHVAFLLLKCPLGKLARSKHRDIHLCFSRMPSSMRTGGDRTAETR